MAKIQELSVEQKERLSEFRDKWLKIGLCTKRANRSVAEQAAKDAYKEAGLEEPKLFIWVDSPRGGLIAAKLMKEVSKKYKTFDMEKARQVRDQVYDQVSDQVYDQVRDQVSDQVYGQVRDQVYDQVRGQVRGQVSDQVYDQVYDQVRDQVYDQVYGQVYDQVRDQVYDQVSGQVYDQVRDQVYDQVSGQVYDQVYDQVSDQVYDQVRGQVYDQVYGQVRGQRLRDEWNDINFYGSHDAYFLSYYDYFLEVCGLEVCKRLKPLMTLAQEVGWTWFYKNCAIFTEKPTEIHRNTENQLHNFNGPALKYADGYSLHAISRIRVPEYITMTPTSEFTKEMILKETNVDFRRCIIQKIGINKAIELLGAKTVDDYDSSVGGKYELLMIDYDGRGEERPYLKMSNPSLEGVFHIEGVKPGVTSVKEAICFRNKLKTFIEPDVLS